jgi:membrane-bound lytic murein transglycosylase D
MVESSFNTKAYSKVGAVGIWQFMPSIGEKFLRVNDADKIDERVSILKSTLAAAQLLKHNYKILGNWTLAVTAYNSGLKGVSKFKKSNIKLHKFVSLLGTSHASGTGLGWAGKNYYAEYLAMVYAEKYRHLVYKKPRDLSSKPLQVEFFEIKNSTTLLSYSVDTGVSFQKLVELNPDIRNVQASLPKGFKVVVPTQKENLNELVSQPDPLKSHHKRKRAAKKSLASL